MYSHKIVLDPLRLGVWCVFTFFGLFCLGPSLHAAAPNNTSVLSPGLVVPEPLKPWTSWVSYGDEHDTCPLWFNSIDKDTLDDKSDDSNQDKEVDEKPNEQSHCIFYSSIKISMSWRVIHFEQQAYVYKKGFVLLPGHSESLWPQQVKHSTKSLVVTTYQNMPAVFLEPGAYLLEGDFVFQEKPQFLNLPAEVAIVRVEFNKQPISFFNVDNKHQLWLDFDNHADAQKSEEKSHEEDAVSLQVFRHIDDQIPLLLTTQLELSVSGRERDIILPSPLLPGFVWLSMQSDLEVHLNDKNELMIKARPGTYVLSYVMRAIDTARTFNTLSLSVKDSLWPTQEIWVFNQQPALRSAHLEGAVSIDPKQTLLPDAWKKLPAYQVNNPQDVKIGVDSGTELITSPDELNLQRDVWFNFDGQTLSSKEVMSGQLMNSLWLESSPQEPLSHVQINHENTLIQWSLDKQNTGVEVRHKQLYLEAEKNWQSQGTSFLVSGWNHTFNHVNTYLHLPPGFRLLWAFGPDSVSSSWVTTWTLYDCFLVAMLVVAFYRMYGLKMGVASAVLLVLTFVERDAPQLIWITFLLVTFLCRVVTHPFFNRFLFVIKTGVVIVLCCVSADFSYQKIRTLMHPVLEGTYKKINDNTSFLSQQDYLSPSGNHFSLSSVGPSSTGRVAVPAPAPLEKIAQTMLAKEVDDVPLKPTPKSNLKKTINNTALSSQLGVTQTGLGVPSWGWRKIELSWNGPVIQNQAFRLFIMPPWLNGLIGIFSVILLIVFITHLLGVSRVLFNLLKKHSRSQISCLSFLIGALFLVASVRAEAATEFPQTELLNELKNRLNESYQKQRVYKCSDLNTCFAQASLRVSAHRGVFTLRFELHAQNLLAAPLFRIQTPYFIRSVKDNQKPASALFKQEDGTLMMALSAGVHQIVVEFLSEEDKLVIEFDKKPHQVVLDLGDYQAQGVDAAGLLQDSSLQLSRTNAAHTSVKESDHPIKSNTLQGLKPFFRVERELSLGQKWTVRTRVFKDSLSDPRQTIISSVPLLPNEHVNTEKIKVESNRVWIELSPQSPEFLFESILEQPVLTEKNPQTTLIFQASLGADFVETLRVHSDSLWHVESQGIAPLLNMANQEELMFYFSPRAQDVIKLCITKPTAVVGHSFSIDNSLLEVVPGEQLLQVLLDLHVRSSQAFVHTLTLAEQARVESLLLNEVSQVIQKQGEQLLLSIPIGESHIKLRYTQPYKQGLLFKTPAISLNHVTRNLSSTLHFMQTRVPLWAHYAGIKPAFLLLSMILFLGLASVLLGRVAAVPLRVHAWFLLGLGLIQSDIGALIFVVIVLVLISLRKYFLFDRAWLFNLSQVVFILLLLFSLVVLIETLKHGLLEFPQLYVEGNGSSDYHFNFYLDQASAGILPQVSVWSIPLWLYRGLMLVWAIWLAFTLTALSPWIWTSFSKNGIFKSMGWSKIKNKKNDNQSPPV